MCRVLLMNKQGEKEIEKIYGLDKYLKYLENQLGGHGNRICFIKKQENNKNRKRCKIRCKGYSTNINKNRL